MPVSSASSNNDNVYDQQGKFDQWFYADAKAHKDELKKIDVDDIPGAINTDELNYGLISPAFNAGEKETFSRIKNKFEYMKQYQTQIDGKDHSRDYFELPPRWWNESQGESQFGKLDGNDKIGLLKQALQWMYNALKSISDQLLG